MKLLFVNQHFGSESVATGVLLKQLGTALVARGHQVTVVAGADGQRLRGWVERGSEDGVRLLRVQDASIGDKTIVHRLWHYTSFFALAIWAGLRAERPDLVVSLSTPPLLAPLLARMVAWFHRVPYFYNIQDLYPDVAVSSGYAPIWVQKTVFRLAAFLEAGASGISTVGRTMARQLSKRHQGPVAYLPNWADTNEICPLKPEDSFRKLWGFEGKFVVMYAGNLGVCHDTETILNVIELMHNQPIEFVFVVSAVARRELQGRIGNNPHVHFKPFQPREALNAVLATADVGLVTLSRGMSRFVVPSKAFGIMAAGRPLLAVSDLQDDLCRLIQDSKGGLWASAGNAPEIARAILTLQQNAALRATMGRRARQYVELEHSVPAATRAWLFWLSGERENTQEVERRMAA